MARSSTPRLLSAALITLLALNPSPQTIASAAAKKKISRAAELPRLYFRGPQNPDALTVSPEAFAPLAAAVRAHVEGVLRDYDIADKTTLKNLHTTLAHLALLDGRDDDVLEHVNAARRLEEKTDERLLGITFYSEAIAWASRDAGRGSGDFFLHALRIHVNQYLNQLPWDEVRQAIAKERALLNLTNEHVIPTWTRTQTEPDSKADGGTISLELADRLIFQRVLLTLILPLKNEFMQAFETYARANQSEGPGLSLPVNIWKSRAVTLKGDQKLTQVVLAVWDSGVDTSVFSDRLYVNKRERPNGRDNDGNGFVSDVNGIGFRYDGERTSELIYPIDGEDKRLLDNERATAQGKADYFSGVDSPEARAFKQGIAEGGGDSQPLDGAMNRIMSHAHGTEVSDIAVAGNPAARLLVVRQSFRDDRGDSPLQDVRGWRRFALNALSVVGYCKSHGVRVVNMSWLLSPPAIASVPRGSGAGTMMEEEESTRLAQECFAIVRRGLTLAIQSAPEILFVAAAGNTNQDATFSDAIPPSLELPNLLTVGAVDQSGRPTDFTSFGRTVVLYANGESIEARIPGGERTTVSGTSLAAPQVTNLAAKLYAIDPSLKVADVIELIKNGANPSPNGTVSLINPKRSVVLLEIRKDKKGGQ